MRDWFAVLSFLALAVAGCTAPPTAVQTMAPATSTVAARVIEVTASATLMVAPGATVEPTAAPRVTAALANSTPTRKAATEMTAPPAITRRDTATATRESSAVPPTRQPPATARATATPSPPVSVSEVITSAQTGATTYHVTEITLPTYPYVPFLTQTADPGRAGYPVFTLDHDAYEASNPQPEPRRYRLLVLENRYLRLGILPDLGGRIYECTFKPTGSNEFYSNPVIKPTMWGPPSPPYPKGASWWLATGGLEWGFPVEEHGYEFGTIWGFDHAARPGGGVMITVFTRTGPQAPYAVVDITLPADTAYFIIRPRIVNPLGAAFRFKWWANALLAPGPANTASADLRMILPVSEVTVHSSGDASLPAPGQSMSWSVYNGRDLSRLGAWQSYAGLFARPNGAGLFGGVYDPTADEGMVRVPEGVTAKGLKVFSPVGLDPELWTDDGSTYVELHGGLMATFDDWYELGPGGAVTWSEYWYPVAGIGGLTFASESAAVSLIPSFGGVRVGVFPTTAITGRLTISLAGGAPLTLDVQISPEQPFVRELALPEGVAARDQVAIRLADSGGATVFEWQGPAQLR